MAATKKKRAKTKRQTKAEKLAEDIKRLNRKHKGPCDPKSKRCPAMALVLGSARSTGKGIDEAFTLNLQAGYTGTMLLYRRFGGDVGLQLNYCPWCGGKLMKEEKDDA